MFDGNLEGFKAFSLEESPAPHIGDTYLIFDTIFILTTYSYECLKALNVWKFDEEYVSKNTENSKETSLENLL